MTPKEIIKKWVQTFNDGDANKLASFYLDDSTNHQVANEPVKGKEAIRKMFEDEFSKIEMTCIIENIFADGNWGILEWKDPLGLCGCGFFQIENDKIVFQ